MAGHSKWANIKFKKAAADKKRGKVFTKVIRDIMTAARLGGGEAASNPSLRLALDLAKKNNMPKETVERAIKRGTGEIAGADYVEKVYEGHGPANVAFIAKTLTDNGTRTVTTVRTAFNKSGGQMGDSGAVMWMFKHKGMITYPLTAGAEDAIMEAALEAGAEDFEASEEGYDITTEITDFMAVKNALQEKFGDATEADLTYIPTQHQPVTTMDAAKSVFKLIETLEDDDDVQEVITNMELTPELEAAFAAEE